MPSSSALASFDPALSPATTMSVLPLTPEATEPPWFLYHGAALLAGVAAQAAGKHDRLAAEIRLDSCFHLLRRLQLQTCVAKLFDQLPGARLGKETHKGLRDRGSYFLHCLQLLGGGLGQPLERTERQGERLGNGAADVLDADGEKHPVEGAFPAGGEAVEDVVRRALREALQPGEHLDLE